MSSLNYCPSQDWDRYCQTVEDGWVLKVSKMIQDVDPEWDGDFQAEYAGADDDYISWSGVGKVMATFDDNLENDDVGIVVRTLHKSGKDVTVLGCDEAGEDGNERGDAKGWFGIFAWIEAIESWRLINGTVKESRDEAERYLEFCKGNESVYGD